MAAGRSEGAAAESSPFEKGGWGDFVINELPRQILPGAAA